jgi:hypothetical protein
MSQVNKKEVEKLAKEVMEKMEKDNLRPLNIVGLEDEKQVRSYLELTGNLSKMLENVNIFINGITVDIKERTDGLGLLKSISHGYIHNRDLREYENWLDRTIERASKELEGVTKKLSKAEELKVNIGLFLADLQGTVTENGEYLLSDEIRISLKLFDRYFRIAEITEN